MNASCQVPWSRHLAAKSNCLSDNNWRSPATATSTSPVPAEPKITQSNRLSRLKPTHVILLLRPLPEQVFERAGQSPRQNQARLGTRTADLVHVAAALRPAATKTRASGRLQSQSVSKSVESLVRIGSYRDSASPPTTNPRYGSRAR